MWAMEGGPDKALLDAAQAGDVEAMGQLIQRYQSRVYRFGLRMCRHPEDAEDVLQETLLMASRSIRKFRRDSAFATWLFAIARSFCIKKRRSKKDAPSREASLEGDVSQEVQNLIHPDRDPEERLADQQIMVALERAINTLTPEYREVLVLRDVEGLKGAEVAHIVGLTVAAVKSRLHRARVQVRDHMVLSLEDTASPAQPKPAGCVDVLSLYSKYLEGEVNAELCAKMEQHLTQCEFCRASCDTMKATLAWCKSMPLAPVPTALKQQIQQEIARLQASHPGG